MKRLNETMRKRQDTKQEVGGHRFGVLDRWCLGFVRTRHGTVFSQDIDKLYEARGVS